MLTKEDIEELRKKIHGTFSDNPNRVNADNKYDYVQKSYAQITDEYAQELDRVNKIFDEHLKTVTGDISVSRENLDPLKNKIKELQTVFCSMLDGREKDEAAADFNKFIARIDEFAYMIQKPKPGDEFVPASKNHIDSKLTHLSDALTDLSGIASAAFKDENPEALDLCNDIIKEMRKVCIKNDPEHPTKDMLGITSNGPINGVYTKVLAPMTIYTNLKSETVDYKFPKDADGHREFQELESLIKGIRDKFAAIISGKSDQNITEEDYINVAKKMEHIIETYPVFADEMPNASQPLDNFGTPYPVNEILNVIKISLEGWKEVFPEIKEIAKISDSVQKKLDNRYKEEYERLAKIAFNGDVIEEGDAKNAWERMGSLKNMNDELQELYNKDRLAMTMFSDEYRGEALFDAIETVEKITEDADKFQIRYYDRQPDKSKVNHLNRRFNQVVDILNDSIAQEAFIWGVNKEKNINEDYKKNSPEWFVGGKSQKELNAFKKGYPENRKFAHKRVDAFLKNIKKNLPELNRDYYAALDKELRGDKNPALAEKHLTKEEFQTIELNDPKIANVDINGIIQRSIVRDLKKNARELNQLYGFESVQEDDEKGSMIRKCVSDSTDILNINFDTAAAILGKGSDAAVLLRNDLTSYRETVKAGEEPDGSSIRKLFTSAQNYLHMKAGVPGTSAGKKRVAAGQEILIKTAKALMTEYKDDKNVREAINNELRTEMIRSEKFRNRMVKDALEVIEQARKNHIPPEGHQDIEEALETLAFADTVKSIYGKNQKELSKVKLDSNKNIEIMLSILDNAEKTFTKKLPVLKVIAANNYDAIFSQHNPVNTAPVKKKSQTSPMIKCD